MIWPKADIASRARYVCLMLRPKPAIAAIVALLATACASVPETKLTPSEAVAQQGSSRLWWQDNAADPGLLESVSPQFTANPDHQLQAGRALRALAVHFPKCQTLPNMGYATWARADHLLVLFELRRSPGCPTTPLVSLNHAGGAVIVLTPDQPSTFD